MSDQRTTIMFREADQQVLRELEEILGHSTTAEFTRRGLAALLDLARVKKEDGVVRLLRKDGGIDRILLL